jgi:hypothetical protein
VVGPGVRRVSARRLAFLSSLFRELGVPRARSLHLARIAYSAYLGLGELDALGLGLKPADHRAYVKTYLEILLP